MNLAASDWATARGEKWRDQRAGMEAMLAPVDAPLIEALALDVPCRIADVACGAGGTTFEIARRAPAGSVVHGFDISQALVEAARARPSEGHDVSFEVANAATFMPERAYDRLVSRFGMMFFDDPPAAFANVARWLAPGGRFVFAVWAAPADNEWITTVREVVSTIVEVPKPAPDTPGPFRYGDVAALTALLERAGFVDVEVRDWRGALAIEGTPAEAAAFALAAFSAFGDLLAQAGGDALDRAREALAVRFESNVHDGGVRFGARAHLVRGAR